MERNYSNKQAALEKRLSQFLSGHIDQWFTVQELSKEVSVSGSLAEIQTRIMAMQRIGLVRSQKKGLGEPWSYQAIHPETT
jgi:hypothetical protein